MSCPSGHCKAVFSLPLHATQIGSDVAMELSELPWDDMQRRTNEIYAAVERRLASEPHHAEKGDTTVRPYGAREGYRDVMEEAHRLMRANDGMTLDAALTRAASTLPGAYKAYDDGVKSGTLTPDPTPKPKDVPITGTEAERADVEQELRAASEAAGMAPHEYAVTPDGRHLALVADLMTTRRLGRKQAEALAEQISAQ
ncbi:MAG: hypothetical protein WBD55_10910 [Dehalococcoidia bacterium]